MVYQWREGSRWRAKAQEVGDRLEALREAHGGQITPHDIVADARQEISPLHRAFEWDDAKAADEYRVHQARQLIADVMVVFADDVAGAPKQPIRAFASLGETPAYTSLKAAMESPQHRREVLEQARRELEGWRRRYKQYQQLAGAIDKVNAALATMETAA